ncbi:hypothetical protein VTL71DRAFT_6252 [Oculimacula yallundae]|uniref:Uncharacterized protein n=1 Tax=Oculimacula yallundae TaxID=86028 RepID=A0ABR4BZU0_9HELO
MADPKATPVVALAPWTLKGTIYTFLYYISPSAASELQDKKSLLYSPLEANSSFSKGKLIGGLASVQIIRYTESPVGPYDELILIPGKFEYEVDVEDASGEVKKEKKQNLRITKIFVSQETTCWNGRNNWNIPKHIAEFEFKSLPDGALRISVFPMEFSSPGKIKTRSKSAFFSAVYKPISCAPYFPMSTAAANYVGLDLMLVQPPVPDGKEFGGELVGTEEWCSIIPYEWSKKTSLGWWDLKRGKKAETDALLCGEDEGEGDRGSDEAGHENWWPGFGRWRIGAMMEDAEIKFPEGEHWADT